MTEAVEIDKVSAEYPGLHEGASGWSRRERNSDGRRFRETCETIVINAHGGLLYLMTSRSAWTR